LLTDTGLFGAYIGTDKKNIANSISLVHKELEKTQEDTGVLAPSSKEHNRRSKGTMMLGLENMSSRMMRLGSSELYYQRCIPLDAVLKKVDAVYPHRKCRKSHVTCFDLDKFSTVIIRPS
jgi:predicted Zn-dependent peptidase